MGKKQWKRLCVNISEEENASLNAIAGFNGVSVSSLVRSFIEVMITQEKVLLEGLSRFRQEHGKD